MVPLAIIAVLVQRRVRSWWLLLPLAGACLRGACHRRRGAPRLHRASPAQPSRGVTIGGLSGFVDSVTDRVALGILVGLVAGKVIGILGATYVMARFTRATLDPHLRWVDMLGMSLLAGIGFTVSLLIGELAFGAGSVRDEHVKVGVS